MKSLREYAFLGKNLYQAPPRKNQGTLLLNKIYVVDYQWY